MNDMPELLVVALERNHDPVLEELRHPADALLEVRVDHVRLLELIMRIVHHDRNSVRDLIAERLADGIIG